MKHLTDFRHAALLLFIFAFAQCPQLEAAQTYEAQLAEARRFADEKSWALARNAYAEALKLAPDDEAKRWCELWHAEAEWRGTGKKWENNEKLLHRLDAWETPYKSDVVESKTNDELRQKDDFWAETMLLRIEISDDSSSRQWKLRTEILKYYASQTPSGKNKERLLKFVRNIDYSKVSNGGNVEARGHFAELLVRIAQTGLLATEDNAWCGLVGYGLSKPDVQAQHRLGVEALCRNTSLAPVADAMIFVAEVKSGDANVIASSSESSQAAWREGYAGLLAKAKTLRARLPDKSNDFAHDSAAKALDALIGQWNFPHLRGYMPPTIGTSDRVEFSVGMARLRNVRAELYTYDFAAYQVLSELVINGGELQDMALLKRQREVASVRLLRSMSLFSEPPEDEFAWQTDVFRFDEPLAPGFYMLSIIGDYGDGETLARTSHFEVSDVYVVAMSSSVLGLVDMYILGKNDGRPVPDVEVKGAWFSRWTSRTRSGGTRVGESWQGKTDAHGRVKVPYPEKDCDYAAIVANGHPVVARSWWMFRRSSHDEEKKIVADLFLDRPLYRPGETVRWKLIARERQDGRLAPCKQQGKLSVKLNHSALLNDVALSFNEFGTTHGEFVIPASANPGTAHWDVKLGDASVYLYNSFRVDNFVPPAISAKVNITSPQASVKPGNEIVFKFNAQYYSGGGVADVPVMCRIHVDYEMNKTDAASRVAYQECRKWADELGERNLQGITNGNGDAEFRLKLHDALPEGAVVWIHARANAPSMPDVRVETAFCVSKIGVFANPKADVFPMLAEPRAESVFSFDMVDMAGTPCPFEGKAVVTERRWLEIWLDKDGSEVRDEALAAAKKEELKRRMSDARSRYEVIYGYYGYGEARSPLPEGWTKVFAGYVRTPVLERKVACDGNGRLDVKFTPPHEGIFDVSVEKDGKTLIPIRRDLRWSGRAFEERTNDMRDGRWIFVAANEQTKSLAFKPDEALIIGLDKIRSGEAPRVLLVRPDDCSGVYFSITGGRQVLAQRFALPDRVGFVAFEDALNVSGEVCAEVFDFNNNRNIVRASASIRDTRTKLLLDIATAKTAQRPGAAAAAEIVAKDSSGNPVRAELAVAVADNALLNMTGTRRSRLQEPIFHWPSYPGRVKWESSYDLEWIWPVRRITDTRPGATVLVRMAGKTYETELIEDEAGIIQVDSFTQQGMAPMLADSAEERPIGGTLGEVFGLNDLDSLMGVRNASGDGIRLRRHFASTAFWEPELVTGKDGRAQVSFTYPDNLTQWRFAAYAVGEDGNTFGTAQVMTRTSLPLQARLLAPRFLIEGDEAALSGLFVNRTDADLKVSAQMRGEWAVEMDAKKTESVLVPKQNEARVSWNAKASTPGEAVMTLAARAGKESDAMRIALPVLEDGIRQDTAASARLAPSVANAEMTLALPTPLNRERLDAEVVISQGRADVMLNALPYLIDYPYGCVEQTMSRFLPAVVVRKTLRGFGFDAGVVEKRILEQEVDSARTRRERLAGLRKLDDVVTKSLGRLREAEHYRNGFGWWPGSGSTDLWMTAYVTWGLQLAGEADVEISDDWLKSLCKIVVETAEKQETVDDRLAWALFVMGEVPTLKIEMNDFGALRKVYARVYAEREKLSASGRACLLAASAKWGADAERAVLLRNLENGAQRTAWGAHWGATSGYWRATEGAVETTALTVMALLKVDPGSALLEPALDWLVMNRRGSGWQNTRVSAFAVLALARSVTKEGADGVGGDVDVFLNGKKLHSVILSKESLLAGAMRVPLPAELLQGGDNRIELRNNSATAGKGSVYATALASAWARGDSVKPAGNLISVERGFSGRRIEPTLGGDGKLQATAMAQTGAARAGDEVTARVVLSVPDRLEYMMIAVPKPAGCEPLNPLSGWDAELVRVGAAGDAKGQTVRRRIYREEHDDHSAFFLDHVEAGEWEIRFAMRAVTQGDFRALPVKVEAMYVPEIRANSDARRVRIE